MMGEYNLKTVLLMKHDTPQNWIASNPILRAGEVGVAIDSDTGVCTLKVGDGVHHWNDLTLMCGEREYVSARDAKGNEVCRWYNEPKYYSAIKGLQQATSAMGISASQASEAIRNVMQAMNTHDTIQELANYISPVGEGSTIAALKTREEPARSQPKDLRSSLKTLSRAIDEYNITEVNSDIKFDF